ncbi:DUF6452 family protein [Dokdonia sp. PRO95]|uniref:DUF6452 family protein n=1 Tax=Dokdonia sp. PRO95 TaxID=1239415 RepID=UPI000555D5C5|nr:DUF6452 family protein [Dokdonia sp. PRO95]
MRKLLLILIISASLGQSSCERDDICAETTPTTPLLIIDFYDVNNPSLLKAPNNLTVTTIIDQEVNEVIALVNLESIEIPLRTNAELTTYSFTINTAEDDEEEPNTDDLTFTYTVTDEFVNKACGFRVVYDDLQNTIDPQQDGAWIQNIDIENPTVNDQTEAHISIFH